MIVVVLLPVSHRKLSLFSRRPIRLIAARFRNEPHIFPGVSTTPSDVHVGHSTGNLAL